MKEVHYISSLSAFVDRELPKEEQQKVAEHLLVCAECRQEHDRLKFTAGLATHLEHSDAPPNVWAAVEAGLDRKDRADNARGSAGSWFNFPVIAGYAGAAVFLFAFAGLAYFFLFTGEPYQAKLPANAPSVSQPSTNSAPSAETNVAPQNTEVAVNPVNGNTNTAAALPTSTGQPSTETAPSQSFEIETLAGAPKVGSQSTATNLAVGDFLETDAVSKARIEVADIGNVEIRPNSRVKLVGTNAKQHRLALDRGSLHAKIYAPPRLFIVDTPTATAVDLGCEYTLDVDEKGNNKLHVTSGFVALERAGRESIVPAGAMCLTRKGKGLGTPFSAETTETFRKALESFDFGNGGSRAVDDLLASKNFFDIISLWHLLSRVSKADRERIFDALAAYVTPPKYVTKEGIMVLNKKMLESWREDVERAWFD